MRSKPVFVLALAVVGGLFCLGPTEPAAAQAKDDEYTIEAFNGPPPTELAAPIRAELGPAAIRLKKGTATICEIWLRTTIPTAEPGDTLGRSYPQIADTVLLGAIRVVSAMKDNRSQAFPTGVYLMRHAIQPQNGDHTGSTDFIDFAMLLSAKNDQTVKGHYLNATEMHKQSIADKGADHPIVFALMPPKAATQPNLTKNEKEHWVLDVKAGTLVLAFVIVGSYEH